MSKRPHAPIIALLALIVFAPTGQAKEPSFEAKRWYRLGLAAEHGEGVEIDKAQAFSFYCRAAKAGHPGAMHSMGWMYLNGRGVPTDESKAAYWLSLASANGDRHAKRLMKRLILPMAGSDERCFLGKPKGVQLADNTAKPAEEKAPTKPVEEPEAKAQPEPPTPSQAKTEPKEVTEASETTVKDEPKQKPAMAAAKEEARPVFICGRLGPIKGKDLRTKLEAWLSAYSVATKEVGRERQLGELHQVFLPSQGSEKAARQLIAQYQQQGISDMQLITKGSERWGVSLGVYGIKANADRRVADLKSKGIDTSYRNQAPIHQERWMTYKAPETDAESLARSFPQLINERLDCR